MTNPTANSPENEDTSPYESLDSKKLHAAAGRALDLHLGTPADKKPKRRNGDLFGRGRNGSHLPPPAQIRTCGITAYGSCLGF